MCTYTRAGGGSQLLVIVYQPDSGVTFDNLKSINAGVGDITPVSGVGGQAILGSIEIDAQVGTKLLAIQGAGGNLTGDPDKAIALAKVIAAAL